MRKSSKILLFIGLACGVAVSWAKTADQRPSEGLSAQARLAQSLGKTEKKAALAGSKKEGKKAITPQLPGHFLTPKSIHSGDGDGKNSGSSDSADGWSSEIKSAGPNAAGSNRLVSDESAKAIDPNSLGGAGKKKVPQIAPPMTPRTSGGGEGAIRGSAEKKSYWWPVCAFIDEKVDEANANIALKGMVDRAAACDVAIQVFPVRVANSSWTNDPKVINEATIAKCDLPNGLQGSTTAFVEWANTAAKMCKAQLGDKHKTPDIVEEDEWDLSVAGCAELRHGSAPTKEEDRASMERSHHSHSEGGTVAASIEVPNGQTPSVVSHEALGHSMMGKPNGSQHGMGIGEPEDTREGGAGEFMTDSWTSSGCSVMRSKAHSNDSATISKYFGSGSQPFAYDPSRTTYYRPSQALYNMKSSPSLFSPSNGIPAMGPIQVAAIPQGVPGKETTSALDSRMFDKGNDKVFANTEGKPEADPGKPEMHREGQTRKPTAASKSSLEKIPAQKSQAPVTQENPVAVSVPIDPPVSAAPAKRANKVVWADDAKPVSAEAFGGVASKSSGSSGGISNRTQYDESAAVNPYAGAADSGPSTKPTPSNALSMGSGFSAGAATTSGSAGKVGAGSGFDNGVFQGLGEGEESEESLEKRRRKKSKAPAEGSRRRSEPGNRSGRTSAYGEAL